MDNFEIRGRYSDGNIRLFHIVEFGPCAAMHTVLSEISENDENAYDIESIEIVGFSPVE